MARKAATKKSSGKADRPAQIVVTMTEQLKKAVTAKAKASKTPVARAVRAILEKWAQTPAKAQTTDNTASDTGTASPDATEQTAPAAEAAAA